MIVHTNAKVIVAGEHAVLRNSPALVLPVTNIRLTGNYQQQDCFHASCSNPGNDKIWAEFIKNAYALCSPQKLSGKWQLTINFPAKIGLGFSSALCALMAKWLHVLGLLAEHDIFSFAHKLEQPIHGISSGCDIAGALSEQAIVYKMPGNISYLANNWQPNLAWSYTGSNSSTKDMIKHVAAKQNMDAVMQTATMQAITAWEQEDLAALASSIILANSCFQSWGLITSGMQQEASRLMGLGALAVKPTGAGGGALLSLWQNKKSIEGLNWIH